MLSTHCLSQATIAAYRRDGFAILRNLLSASQARAVGARCLDLSRSAQLNRDAPVFRQILDCWRLDAEGADLARHPTVAGAARELAGVPLRLWHDHLLVKLPGSDTPTCWHQDRPYWPFVDGPSGDHALSVWVALDDVPEERGCMRFLPGSHVHDQLAAQDLGNPRDLFSRCPELEYTASVSTPLRAGDATVHHGRCAHMAFGNRSDQPRLALAVIYMPVDTRFSGQRHPVTEALGLAPGAMFPTARFPEVMA